MSTENDTLITPAGGEGLENLGSEIDAAFAVHSGNPAPASTDTLNGDAPKTETTPEPKTEPTPKTEPAPEPKTEPAPKTETTPEPKAEQDEFDKHQLPAHARPSTAKQFDEVKAIGRRMVAEEKAKREALEKEFAEFKSKAPAAGELPKDVQDELTKLRSIVNRTSYQESPDFVKQYAEPLAKQEDAVWAALKGIGYSDEDVAKAKELGIDGIDWNKAVVGADERKKTLLFNAIAKRDELSESKREAINKASADAEAYKKAIADAPDRSVVELETGVKGANQMLDANGFFEEVTEASIPKDMPKELIEAYNAGGTEAKKFIEVASKGTFKLGELIAMGAASQRYIAVNTALNKHVGELRGQFAAEKARADKAEAEITRIRGAGAAPRTPAGAPGKGTTITDDDDMDSRFRAHQVGGR